MKEEIGEKKELLNSRRVIAIVVDEGMNGALTEKGRRERIRWMRKGRKQQKGLQDLME